jgi:hypothetical protein
MSKRKLNPAFRRLLAREFPQMELEEVLNLLDMGLLRLKKVRCAAWSRKPRRPCRAQALFLSDGTRGLCRHHGGIPKSAAGRKAISDAQKRRWAKWREQQRSEECPVNDARELRSKPARTPPEQQCR